MQGCIPSTVTVTTCQTYTEDRTPSPLPSCKVNVQQLPLPQEKLPVDAGLDGHRKHLCQHRLPARSSLWRDNLNVRIQPAQQFSHASRGVPVGVVYPGKWSTLTIRTQTDEPMVRPRSNFIGQAFTGFLIESCHALCALQMHSVSRMLLYNVIVHTYMHPIHPYIYPYPPCRHRAVSLFLLFLNAEHTNHDRDADSYNGAVGHHDLQGYNI